ncbi:hypothetical protein BM1_07558 [Bipolaris maydis]|nr:hypothetical protein BM1_07558 [Bipolaris maydis]
MHALEDGCNQTWQGAHVRGSIAPQSEKREARDCRKWRRGYSCAVAAVQVLETLPASSTHNRMRTAEIFSAKALDGFVRPNFAAKRKRRRPRAQIT